jgi:hypothetical protein
MIKEQNMNSETENYDEEYFCSECNSPVKEEDIICPNCRANLAEIIDKDIDDGIVTVRTYSSEIEAQMAISHLISNNIDAIISRDDSGGMRPHLQYSTGVRILVNKSDYEKAVEILDVMNC